ncbi:MAG: long-chain fatty acid--CoA ligase [Sphingomonadales bacterium]|nr:long-chain fatty acid--CoA ligase [Sphingomonadales bacterium]
MDVSETIRGILTTEPERNVMEWQGKWWQRGSLATFAGALDKELDRLGVTKDMAVALAARNRPNHCYSVLTLLAGERPISMLYAYQAAESLARDITNTRFAVLLLDEQDWSETMAQAAEDTGTPVILLGALPEDGFRTIEPKVRGDLSQVLRQPSCGIEILSSGTTGLPKRLFHPASVLFRSLRGNLAKPAEEPDLVFWPMGGIGGNLNLAVAMSRGVPFILLEKFTVEALVDAIRRHKLSSVGLTPTMVRMLYDAGVMPEDVPSLKAIGGGSGPLDPDLQDKVEERFGFPVIWAMGATEFCGTIISWSFDLHKQYSKTKRGSMGKVLPGCQVKIVDPETDEELPTGEVGRMMVQADSGGPDWIRTTDLARIDEDGFLFHTGRSDGAIIRGGFKIVPEKVCETLRLHPDVAEASVVGIDEARLGQVPVAVIEPQPGKQPTPAELEKHLRGHLAAPQIPVRFFLVDKLPYTASTKVHVAEVRKIVAELMAQA